MDLHLRGATVVDGTGGPSHPADVIVAGDRITAIEPAGSRPAVGAAVVDLGGLVLAPGFIDPHTHYDAQVLWDPTLSPSSWHGVTTVVMGNCGFGIAPTRPADRTTIMRVLENVEGMPFDALEAGIPWTFESYPEYLDALDRLPLRINVASLLGHTPLRFYVMGDDATERPASESELARMRALADEALAAGAVGFSTSRSTSHLGAYGRPVPSRAADMEEIRHLARALGDAGHGTFEATWGPDLFVDEFAEIAGDIGRPVTWAAIMATARQPGYAAGVAARTAALGGRVFPQIAGKPIVVEVTLADPFPFANVPAFHEILALPHHERAARYADPAWAERADAGLRELWGDPFGAGEVAASDRHPELVAAGPLGVLAAGRGTTAIRFAAELALEEGLTTRFRVAMTNDDAAQVDMLLRDHNLLLGLSDAGAHTSQLCDANYATHLLGYWHRQRGTLSLEDAVWRLTGQPAEVYELADRGVLRAGAVADLVAFDPEQVGSGPLERVADFPAGADRLVARSTGIEHVWVAGTAIDTAIDTATATGPTPGRLLRHGR